MGNVYINRKTGKIWENTSSHDKFRDDADWAFAGNINHSYSPHRWGVRKTYCPGCRRWGGSAGKGYADSTTRIYHPACYARRHPVLAELGEWHLDNIYMRKEIFGAQRLGRGAYAELDYDAERDMVLVRHDRQRRPDDVEYFLLARTDTGTRTRIMVPGQYRTIKGALAWAAQIEPREVQLLA